MTSRKKFELLLPLVQSGHVGPASPWRNSLSQWSWGGGSCQYAGAPLWRWTSCGIVEGCGDLQTLSGEPGVRRSRRPTSAAGKPHKLRSAASWKFDLCIYRSELLSLFSTSLLSLHWLQTYETMQQSAAVELWVCQTLDIHSAIKDKSFNWFSGPRGGSNVCLGIRVQGGIMCLPLWHLSPLT